MFRRLSTRVLATLLVASMLVLPGAIVALGAEGGTGPADALSPTGEWMPLAAGQQEWFAFKSDSSTSPVAGPDGRFTQRFCDLQCLDAGGCSRLGRRKQARSGGTRCEERSLLGGDLVWTGHSGDARHLLRRGRSGRSGSGELSSSISVAKA